MKHRIILLTLLMMLPFAAEAQMENKGTAIVAHRGYWNCEEAGYAKNSIASLKCAQQAGVWGSEFDVRITSDNVVLVFHDSKIDGKRIEHHPYSEFKDHRLKNGELIPTLDQYLEQAKKSPKTVMVFELKKLKSQEAEDRMVEISLQKLKEHGLLSPERVVFISFSKHICKSIASQLPDFTVQYLNGDLKPKAVLEEGINGIDYNHTILKTNRRWVANAHKLGMSTNAWTTNTENEIVPMLKLKINMITTDEPILARQIMKEKGFTEIIP